MAFWGKIKSRGNVDDRRSNSPLAIGSGLGVGGVILVLALSYFLNGSIDPGLVLDSINGLQNQQQTQNLSEEELNAFAGADDYEMFVATVLGSNNEIWKFIFDQNNRQYQEPTVVLFRGATESACGYASSQMGPHYCPVDSTIYIDETFFDELQRRFKAQGGDVAEAYVIAHEVGHHVQNLLGTIEQVRAASQANPNAANDLSIAQELQADCYAGLWAYHLKDKSVFEPGEINEALDAAAAVGDDNIQEKVSGSINPESWTHGSSEQRQYWFNIGFEQGSLTACNTFNS